MKNKGPIRSLAIALWAFSCIFLCGESGKLFAQQDVQYSQYMFNMLSMNPAYAGSREALSTSMHVRRQWTGISGAPATVSLTGQMPLRKKKIGVGVEVFNDNVGPKSVTSLLASYAYRIPVGKGKLAAGLRMGIYNYSFNWDKMDYKDQAEIYNVGGRTSTLTGTGDFGMYYYSRTFYWGAAFTHLNQGKVAAAGTDSTARQSIHVFIPVGKSFEVGNVILNPTMLLKTSINSTATIDLNMNVRLKDKLWLGVSARGGYGFVFLTQFQVNDKMKVGYSYDYGINKIGHLGKGSHEIMIGYDINIFGTKMIMPRYL